LGEAQAKCEYIANAALEPDLAKRFRQVYLAKGTLATTAIEGNSLSEEAVRQRIEGRLKLPPSQEYLGQQIDSILEGFRRVEDRLLNERGSQFTVDLIKSYNALVLRNQPLDEDVIPGEIRRHSVEVGRYRGAPAEDCAYLLQRLCDAWLNPPLPAPPGFQMALEIVRAMIAHLYFAWIHPFGDGNGRIARLIEFEILFRAGIPDIAAHLLSNHYNLTRDQYYRQLEQSSRSGGDVMPFIEYALQGFVDGLKSQIDILQIAQLRVYWRDYIHRQFEGGKSAAQQRRLCLMLDLSERVGEWTRIGDLRGLSTRLAEQYAGKSDKTLRRDVNALKEMNLIEYTSHSVRLNLSLLTSFLPTTIQNSPPET
jgi:Fic family protein